MSKPILVGYDPRKVDRAPVDFGVAAARFTGAPLIVTSVQAGARLGKDLEDVEGEHRLWAERRLREAVDELDGDVSVEVEAVVGDPTETLVDASQHLDLLVCGSRGYGPVRGVLLGSVSRRVTAEARCPVIVPPRGVKASLEALVSEAPGAAAPA